MISPIRHKPFLNFLSNKFKIASYSFIQHKNFSTKTKSILKLNDPYQGNLFNMEQNLCNKLSYVEVQNDENNSILKKISTEQIKINRAIGNIDMEDITKQINDISNLIINKLPEKSLKKALDDRTTENGEIIYKLSGFLQQISSHKNLIEKKIEADTCNSITQLDQINRLMSELNEFLSKFRTQIENGSWILAKDTEHLQMLKLLKELFNKQGIDIDNKFHNYNLKIKSELANINDKFDKEKERREVNKMYLLALTLLFGFLMMPTIYQYL